MRNLEETEDQQEIDKLRIQVVTLKLRKNQWLDKVHQHLKIKESKDQKSRRLNQFQKRITLQDQN